MYQRTPPLFYANRCFQYTMLREGRQCCQSLLKTEKITLKERDFGRELACELKSIGLDIQYPLSPRKGAGKRGLVGVWLACSMGSSGVQIPVGAVTALSLRFCQYFSFFSFSPFLSVCLCLCLSVCLSLSVSPSVPACTHSLCTCLCLNFISLCLCLLDFDAPLELQRTTCIHTNSCVTSPDMGLLPNQHKNFKTGEK